MLSQAFGLQCAIGGVLEMKVTPAAGVQCGTFFYFFMYRACKVMSLFGWSLLSSPATPNTDFEVGQVLESGS